MIFTRARFVATESGLAEEELRPVNGASGSYVGPEVRLGEITPGKRASVRPSEWLQDRHL